MAKQLQLRRGNLSWWTTNNPVLADGEMVLVSTTNDYVYDQYRIGDGLNTFSSLAIHSFPFNTTIEQFLADAEAARDAAQLAETNAETAEANAEAAEALAEKWATNPEDVAVESGKYSALHWSAKAEDEKLAAEVHKNKSQQWAEASENTQVETGKYSALHWAAKAAASAAGIADSAEMLVKHEAEIASLENVINSANINQETTATATGVDTVALPKTAANTGMQVQMFGQSAQNLVVNGDFMGGTTGWTPSSSAHSAVGGIYTNTGTGVSTAPRSFNSFSIFNNNKYYLKYKIRVTNNISIGLLIGTTENTTLFFNQATPIQNNWYKGSVLATSNVNSTALRVQHSYSDAASSLNMSMEIDYILAINLTSTFGAGNEPTKEQCDILFANYFEGSDNVLGTGRVRSVGKNLFDERYESGIYNITTGVKQALSTHIRTVNFIPVLPSTRYTISPSGTDFQVLYYDINKMFISIVNLAVFNANATPANCRFITFYQQSTNILTATQLERGTAATTYEPYRQSILQLTTPALRSNALIKDEIRKGTNGYELVKRVGVGTLGAEMIANAADREFTSSDGWTFGGTSEISGGTLKINMTGSGEAATKFFPTITGTKNNYFLVSFDLISLNHASNLRYRAGSSGIAYTIPQTKVGQRVYILCNGYDIYSSGWFTAGAATAEIDNYSIKNVTVLTGGAPLLESLSTTGNLSITGINSVNYILATPTISPIAHAGLLNSNSNGTVYFEPVIADAGVYSTNLAIQLTDYPIASFESIRKYANGTYTELSTATAVIASGGLSFTHPDLVSGDLVMFTYAYNRESIGRSMTLSYAISNSNPYYNVTNSVPLTTGYYTSTTARAAVPEGIRKTGLILTYETAAGVWYTERYIGTATDTTSWTTAGNWEIGVLRIAAVTDTTEYAEITI